jgi:hypothetical protein
MRDTTNRQLRNFVEQNHEKLADLVENINFDVRWRESTPGYAININEAREFSFNTFNYLATQHNLVAPKMSTVKTDIPLFGIPSEIEEDIIRVPNTKRHEVRNTIANVYADQIIENYVDSTNPHFTHGIKTAIKHDILTNLAPDSAFVTGYQLSDELRRAHRSVSRSLHLLNQPSYKRISPNRRDSIASAAMQIKKDYSSNDLKSILDIKNF